jgi:hypothetical protein
VGGRQRLGLVVATAAVVVASSCHSTSRRADPEPCRPLPPERIASAAEPRTNLTTPRPLATMDTDGDGHPDDVAAGAGTLSIRRGDGALTLFEPGHDVGLRTWGDLDGDGRDDLIVDEDGAAIYVVSGLTRSGGASPRDAGVRVDDALTYVWTPGLAGGRGADFVVPMRDPQRSVTDVYDGAAVMALAAGSDGRGRVPATQIEGLPRAVAQLVPGGALETLLYVPPPHPAVLIASRPGARLTADLGTGRAEDVLVFDEAGTRKIGLQIDGQVAVWPVPAPCR